MITIKEMADMLRLSTTTVSNVIHGKTGEVSKQTVDKVKQMLEEYDYVPNLNARNLAQNKSKIIGVAIKARKDKYENLIADPFFGELIGSIEKNIRINGYFLMMYISNEITEIIQYASTWNVDALILIGMLHDDYIKVEKKYKKPMILIDSYSDINIIDYVNVGLEDKKGGYEITKYLIENGHTKIAFLSDNMVGVDYQRYLGYRQALKESDIHFTEDNLVIIRPGEDEREESLREIFDLSERYSAFVCTSDYYAVLIMNYLMDRGKKIPEYISIVGFDDNIFARMARPALTTVRQDIELKGKVTVETLIHMIDGGTVEEKMIVLPVSLILRDSVKQIN